MAEATQVRRALATGSLAAAVAATGRLAGMPAEGSSMPAPIEIPDLPSSVAAPIGQIAASVRDASALARAAVRTVPDRNEVVSAALLRGRHAALPAGTANAVDLALMQRAALLLAQTLDETIPRLAGAAVSPTRGEEVNGCDLFDDAPRLCVGGSGGNTITRDYAIVVDLGGEDIYRNTSGGADLLGNEMPVALSLDLGGNDRYEATVREDAGSVAVLGSSFLGVGMLVDIDGNDTYAATSPDAQFYGAGSSLLGVGVLADVAGNDSYRVSSTRPLAAGVSGIGTAFAGLATFHDRDGDDTYLVESRPALGFDYQGRVSPGIAVAQGLGLHTGAGGHVGPATVGIASSAAVFADDAGTDDLAVAAASASIAPDDWRPDLWGSALAVGGGAGSQPWGSMALTGPGTQRWSITADSDSDHGHTWAMGLGYGAGGGYGILSDVGGDDTYLARAHGSSTRSMKATSGCACPDAIGGLGWVLAQGMGEGGTGVLVDLLGDDRYLAEARSDARMELHDSRPEAPQGPAHATATSWYARVYGQGAGYFYGTGVLRDATGDDRYEATVATDAYARTTTAKAGRAKEASSYSGSAEIVAHGSGVSSGAGELHDAGGQDVYRASTAVTATALPPTTEWLGRRDAMTLGAVAVESVGAFSDIDGGGADSFVVDPARPACQGTRGLDAWVDCGSGVGFGVNR